MSDDKCERTSYLTADDLQAANVLHKRVPYALCNVSMSLFSIARHYGGCTFQGCDYTYMPGHDECVRDDVLRLILRRRKAEGKAATNAGMNAGMAQIRLDAEVDASTIAAEVREA